MEENMIRVNIKDRQGRVHELKAPTDMNFNMMEICKAHELPVKGTCGGTASCASCHVYVISNTQLPMPSMDEEDMLDSAFFVEDNSRLGCQIYLSAEMDGMIVQLAPEDESDSC